jgi:hypothetical protein
MKINNMSIGQLQQILAKKTKRLNELYAKRKEYLKYLNSVEKEINLLSNNPLNGSTKVKQTRLGNKNGSTKVKQTRFGNKNEKPLIEHIKQVIKQHGSPMSVKEIASAILKNGYKTFSKDFNARVVNCIWYDNKDLVNVRRGVYALKSPKLEN